MRAKDQEPLKFEDEDIKKGIKLLKRRKAADCQGWKNEMIIHGGREMERSIKKMFNRILQENRVPKEWESMKIKSIYKNRGSRMQLKNRRGLFMTSIISKLFEKTLMEKVKDSVRISEYQCGGKKGRSTKENWIIMMAIIDRNKELKKNTYAIFADAEKCFDKLWLEDSLVQMNRSGLREREVTMIQAMNREAKIVVETPSGDTDEINVKNIVKQGTIYGPQLCCVSTSQVNEIKETPVTVISPSVTCRAMVYVDDISGAGNKNTIENIGRNLRQMEETKKFTFNLDKSKYLVINTGTGKEEVPEIELLNGKMEKGKEYEFLGNYIDEKGTVERQLDEVERKMYGIVKGIKQIGAEDKLGKLSTEARILMYEKTAIPSMTYNMECWSNLRQRDWDHLERIQAAAIKSILHIPKSTPYWGILMETAIWPMKQRVEYQKMMLYHQLMHSDDKRVAKQVVQDQELRQQGKCWYDDVRKIAERLQMNVQEVMMTKKSEWKNMTKTRLQKEIEEISYQKRQEMTKLRHVQGKYERQEYIKQVGIKEASEFIRVRLEMKDIGKNQGQGRICAGCSRENESTEHIMKCQETSDMIGIKGDIMWINGKIEELN